MTFTERDPIRLIVSLDAAVLVPLAEGDNQGARSELQVAVCGQFVSGKYGQFEITERDIDRMIQNYGTVYPTNPTELAIDYDHLSTPDPAKPRMPGDGKAAGWIKRLFKRATLLAGKPVVGMFAEVEYTPSATKMVREKEYRFFSPTFVKEWTTGVGKKIGATLLGGALTNHPFLHGMNAVSLSDELAIPYTGASAMAKVIKVKNTKGEDVEINLDDAIAQPEVAAHFAPKTDATADAAAKAKADADAAAKAAADAAAAAAANPGNTAAQIAATNAAVQQAVQSALAPLVTSVTTLSSEVARLKSEKADDSFDQAFNAALRDGKVTPAQRESMKTLHDLNPVAWKTSIDAAPKIVKLDHNHGASSTGGDTSIDNADVQAEMDAAVAKYVTDHPTQKLDYASALTAIGQSKDPKLADLARRFQLSFREA